MILEAKDIKARLMPMPLDIPQDHLDLIAEGKIPEKLKKLLEDGHIIIDPFPEEERISSSSIDLQFGSWIETRNIPFEQRKIDDRQTIRLATYDFREEQAGRRQKLLESTRKCEIREGGTHIKFYLSEDETFELPPNLLVLAPTRERVYVPTDLVMELEGRSRFARKGIMVHFTSSRFHAGWCGEVVMEIMNGSPASFNLYPGLEITAISFEPLSKPTEEPYYAKKNARFRGQKY